jgi:hypothetical protein
MAPRTILVTGDHGIDYDIYLHTDQDNPPIGTPPTIIRASDGGAGIMYGVLTAAARANKDGASAFDVAFVPARRPDAPPTAAIWAPFELGSLGVTPGDQKSRVWRTRRSINLGPVSDPSILPMPAPLAPDPGSEVSYSSDILAIEDGGSGFRVTVPKALLEFLEGSAGALPQWILLKTCAPVGHGMLWWALAGRAEVADRTIVVASVYDLRQADVRVSKGISWERTAEDLARELMNSPALAGLRQVRHVIVTFYGEGALWMERAAEPGAPPRIRLMFDPACMEEEWARKVAVAGNAYGFHSVFAATVAARLAIGAAPGDPSPLATGIARGLLAMRALRALGHGPVKKACPGLPAEELGGLAAAPTVRAFAEQAGGRIQWARLGTFGETDVPVPGAATSNWRMLEATDRGLCGMPLYGKARRVALLGTAALDNVPYARFGRLFTADRDEIEALRNLKRLMEAYAEAEGETKPLSLAVFGPPGAGKSFGIKQIADSVIDEKRRAVVEFNLSQFDDPDDLIGAFHQVRDKVLDGKLPLVFWDEFDAQDYRWLQFLLAPMQDGRFQEGQITHPIGRSVFVFAGATSYTCEDFGPPDRPASDSATDREQHRLAVTRFRLKKGPDFKSRLHGFLNVLGPNPRQRFTGTAWEDDPSDVCFPVRRALLLRSLLGLMTDASSGKRLEMDPGLVAALLEVGRYRHGSRSFEKIADALKRGGGLGFHRSALPSDEVLAMNVEPLAEFKRLLDHSAVIQPYALLLAAAIHARWLQTAAPENHFTKVFENLPAETKGDNVAAALRIPDILGLAGLELVPGDDPRPPVGSVDLILQSHLETLAEEEHRGWMEVRLQNGWRPCDRVTDPMARRAQREARLNDCLVPYVQLPHDEQEKDRGAILWYPKAAALVGFKIVAKGAAGPAGIGA